jgi:hypothetical protein
MTLAPFDRRGDPPRGGRQGGGRGHGIGAEPPAPGGRATRAAEGQALFSAGLVVELELALSEFEDLEDELMSAAFLA